MKLSNGGYSVKDIRARIEQNYKSKYRFITPTPHPPHTPAKKK